MNASTLPVLALAAASLGGCRTLTDPAPALSLGAAVAEAGGTPVTIVLRDGRSIPDARRLRLDGASLVYERPGAVGPARLAGADVRQLRVRLGGDRQSLREIGLGAGPAVALAALGLALDARGVGLCRDSNELICLDHTMVGLALGAGIGVGLNARHNPRRVRVLYDASAR